MFSLNLYRPSLRAVGAIAVLMAWVGSLTWLSVRRLGRTEDATLSNEATLRLAPGTEWYALYAGSVQIGNAGVTLDTLSPGYRISEASIVETRSGAGLARATRRTETWLGATLNLERIHSQYTREGRQSDWELGVTGDTVVAHFTGPSMTQGRVWVAEAPTMLTAMPYRLALGGELEARRARDLTMLDSWPPATRPTSVAIAGDSLLRFADSSRTIDDGLHWVAAHFDSTRVYGVTINGAGGPRRVWIDRRGTISGRETVFGARWVRTDFDLSETAFRKNLVERGPTMLAALPVIDAYATAGINDTVTAVRRFLVQHRDSTPVDRGLLALLAGGRQGVVGDTITVSPGGRDAGASARDTISDPMIQSDAGAIGTLKRRLISGPVDSTGLIALIHALHQLIRLDTSSNAAEDALGTLGRRAGRADGVARLMVALLRADHVPARYVIGVYPDGDRMLTHAWVEVWRGPTGGWIACDPAMNRAVSTTGLIRLAFGGSSHPDQLLLQLANARLTEIPHQGTR